MRKEFEFDVRFYRGQLYINHNPIKPDQVGNYHTAENFLHTLIRVCPNPKEVQIEMKDAGGMQILISLLDYLSQHYPSFTDAIRISTFNPKAMVEYAQIYHDRSKSGKKLWPLDLNTMPLTGIDPQTVKNMITFLCGQKKNIGYVLQLLSSAVGKSIIGAEEAEAFTDVHMVSDLLPGSFDDPLTSRENADSILIFSSLKNLVAISPSMNTVISVVKESKGRINLPYALLSKSFVREVQELGLLFSCFAANEANAIRDAFVAGASRVISDVNERQLFSAN